MVTIHDGREPLVSYCSLDPLSDFSTRRILGVLLLYGPLDGFNNLGGVATTSSTLHGYNTRRTRAFGVLLLFGPFDDFPLFAAFGAFVSLGPFDDLASFGPLDDFKTRAFGVLLLFGPFDDFPLFSAFGAFVSLGPFDDF